MGGVRGRRGWRGSEGKGSVVGKGEMRVVGGRGTSRAGVINNVSLSVSIMIITRRGCLNPFSISDFGMGGLSSLLFLGGIN